MKSINLRKEGSQPSISLRDVNVQTKNQFARHDVTVILSVYLFATLYIAELASWYLEEMFFVASVIFGISSCFILSYLFFLFPSLSLALVVLVPYLVFIGGRIIVLLITGDVEVFDFTYFADYQPSRSEAAKLILRATVGFLCVFIGYLLCVRNTAGAKPVSKSPVLWKPEYWAMGFLLIGSPILIWELVKKIKLILTEGYAALYLGQVDVYGGSLLSAALTILTLALCFGFSGNNKLIRRLVLIGFTLNSLLLGILGQRGALFSLLILFAALVLEGKSNKKKIVYALGSVLGAFVAMQLFSMVSLREYSLDLRYGNSLIDFLYEQGGSLSIYGLSLELEDYPWSAYVQNFIPGFAVVANLFGHPFSANDISFGAYLANELNAELYNLGHGLGWSLLGDASQFFSFLYPILFLVLGYFLGYVDIKRHRDPFFVGVWILLLAKLPFLPRASTSSVLLPLIYYLVVWTVIALLFKYRSFIKSST